MKRIILLSLITIVLTGVVWLVTKPKIQTVQAIGDVNVFFPTSPLFEIFNWLPGDQEIKNFTVQNNGADKFRLAVRAIEKENVGDLKDIVVIKIFDDLNNVWFGEVTTHLNDWFAQPFVLLGDIESGQMREFSIQVDFPSDAGNEFKKTKSVFDIIIMEEIYGPDGQAIPEECVALGGSPIVGTNGNDRIFGSKMNNLIYGLDGNDKLYGEGGHDCIIGGGGSDYITGGTGKDFIWGNNGDDDINGGSDEDHIWGGAGNDELDGGSDPDLIWGEDGNDEINGGSGNDQIWAGSGDDEVDGGSGRDTVYGNTGNDIINGGSSDDFLYGDEDLDVIDGFTGTDTCIGENKIRCEL